MTEAVSSLAGGAETALGEPLSLGLIGCGEFARRYHVPGVRRDGARARISVVCDVNPTPAVTEIAHAADARLVASVDEVLAPGLCDAVIVSTPHALHHAHALACLRAGRHVLVDKPFVLRAVHATELASLAVSSGLVGAVAFNRRLDDGCLAARRLIAAGGLGPIRHVEALQLGYVRSGWFDDPEMAGGGPFTGRGAHMADLLPWLLGRAPVRLRADVRPNGPGHADRGGTIDLDFGGLDCRITCLDDGLHLWDEVRVFGDRGFIELRRPLTSLIGWQMVHYGDRGEPVASVEAGNVAGDATVDFVSAIVDRTSPPACSMRDAVLSVEIIERAFASARRGGDWSGLPDDMAPAEPQADG